MSKFAVGIVSILAPFLFKGCLPSNSDSKVYNPDPVVIDWSYRTLGEKKNPQWLVDMTRGNSTLFKKMWNIDDERIVMFGCATAATESSAQTLSRLGAYYKMASELQSKVVFRLDKSISEEQKNIIKSSSSATAVEFSGLREETGFYQKIRITNPNTGVSEIKYTYITVFSMDKEVWDYFCRKYLLELMATEGLTVDSQQQIGALFGELKTNPDKKDYKEYKKEQKLYASQAKKSGDKNNADYKRLFSDSSNVNQDEWIKIACDLAMFLIKLLI
ncbi:MAG: hypothetical protein MJ188_08630 [Treponema sp.]|nr:hypothetical protein [Treponema sp.]